MPFQESQPISLEVEDLTFSYGSASVLDNLSFSVSAGEIVSLIGTSGSGKTTLFRLVTGLETPASGKIKINGQLLPEGASYVTYMRQEDLLLPWRTVLENLVLCLELGKKRKNIAEDAQVLLEKVGLKGFENHYPAELSGGMRQRLSLARALLQKRPLLLLDEPFGSLDVLIREQLYALLRQIRLQFGHSILFVTHDFRDAIALSDRVLILNRGFIKEEFQIPENMRNDPLAYEKLIFSIRNALSHSF